MPDDVRHLRNRYLRGRCDAFAIAMALHYEVGVIAFRPVHVGTDGSRRIDPDFVHVAIEFADGTLLDAGGRRSLETMLAEQTDILDLVRGTDDAGVETEVVRFGSAEEFVHDAGVDPSGATEAIRAAALLIPDLGGIVQTVHKIDRFADEFSEMDGPRF